MPVAGGGFDQCDNAQAAVAAGSMLVVATDMVADDKQQIEPTLDKLGALPPALGETETLLADAGYFGDPEDVEACENAGVGSLIAMGRQPHHPPLATLEPRGKSDAGRGDGASVEDGARPRALRLAQTDPGAGARHHQIRARDSVNFPCAGSKPCAASGAS